jgi:hypothetical protein
MWSLTAGCWLGSAGGSRFVRRVRTSSGAVAVQLVTRQGRQVLGIERVGSAHTDEELALLLAAKARLMPGQDPLEVEAVPVVPARMDDVADWTLPIGVGDVRLHHAALRERRRGRRPEGAAQSRHEQGAPGRPAGPGRPTGGSDGVPLEVHLFEGNTAETTTLLPVPRTFQARHGITRPGNGMVVVADAGMLSAGNLNAIEDAGFSFIVGSRITKAPYDLADHFERHGDYFTDGQILESVRAMGSGKHERDRRVVYQWSFKRSQRDNKTINPQIARAEKVAAGRAPMARTRFLKVTGAERELNQKTIDRARQLSGMNGYVSNLDPAVLDGAGVIAAYHQLWQVEASFRMAKSDLRARPVFHHEREAIEAHLTVVFASLAVSRHLHAQTGISIKKLIQTLRVARSATINVNGQRITLDPELTPPVAAILDSLA